MTKKDYELIAKAIRDTKNTYSKGAKIDAYYCLDDVARAISIRLENENPRFDSVKFYRACIGTWHTAV